ncbi:GntR family transcriptional regulator [Aquibacillus albus]|uniref:GntR family transcriptional regulator n=1 Tax=Aquibacillus albus TaxID=1168171 RepID=A0ABS2N1U3_9BACI|nr:GntR family transcriptional regulator [Aquibacillus albus]MBM7572084.1 GntR family transcriptional regulator [Aquibacillus albus]
MTIQSDNNQLLVQAIEQMKASIDNGIFKEKELLPSEFELAKKLGISRTVLKEVLHILEEENIISIKHGFGTIVNAKPLFSTGIEQLGSVTDMIRQSGKIPGTQYISTELIQPTENDIKRFKPKTMDIIAQIKRVRTADGQPVVYCIDKVDKQLLPLEQVHTQDSLFSLLESYSNKYISYAIANIEPIGYHDQISATLNCDPDQALLLLKQMHYTQDDEPVLYSANYFRADMFSFSVLRKRV